MERLPPVRNAWKRFHGHGHRPLVSETLSVQMEVRARDFFIIRIAMRCASEI